MKKTKKITALALAVTLALSAFAQEEQPPVSLTLTNSLGSDKKNLAGDDFLVFSDHTNSDGEKRAKSEIDINDRLQFDLASKHIDSRIRFDFEPPLSGKNTALRTRAYVNFRPVPILNFIAGNAFFSKYHTPGSYIYSEDDIVTTGRLAGGDGGAVVLDLNPLDLPFAVRASAGFSGMEETRLNFGAEFSLKDIFVVGAAAQNANHDSRSIGAYVSFVAVKGLVINAGYTYNFNGGYLADTQHALQGSVSYGFYDIPLKLYADVIAGLTSAHYSEDTGKSVDYLDADGKKSAAPLFASVRAVYGLGEAIDLGLKGVAQVVPSDGAGTLTQFEIYPHLQFKTAVAGTFTTGVRVTFDTDGDAQVAIPILWKYSVSNKR